MDALEKLEDQMYEQAPLLLDDEVFISDSNTHTHKPDSRHIRFWQRPLLIHLTLILFYTTISIITIIAIAQSSLNPSPPLSSNPPRHLTLFNSSLTSPYVGNRSTSTDDAWHTLLSPINQRVSVDTLEANGITSIRLSTSAPADAAEEAIDRLDEYLAWPAALHQLHCVKRLREWIYRDQYHPDLNEREVRRWMLHVDHCIDLLRQSIMCAPDTALIGFHWEQGSEKPAINDEGAVHRCVDWDAYMRGLKGRSVGVEQMRALRRPQS